MNWKSASLAQLYCIAYDDPMATWADREAAKEEILRRVQRRVKNRTARLNALGNAVDPLQIFPIMYAIKRIDDWLREGKGMTCPECGGVGGIQWMDEWGAFTDYMPCETCNGTGEITDESTAYGNDCPGWKCGV